MRTVQPPILRGAPALLLALAVGAGLVACGSSPDRAARRDLAERGIEATDEAFLTAVADGDRETIGLLLALGIRPEASLLRAVRARRCDLLADLVAGGVGVDGVAAARAVLQARREDLPECVSALETAGARQGARTDAGENQLTMAAEAGRTRQIRQMIEAGLPVDTANSRGETALLVAARTGNDELVAQMLELGADVEARDVDGWTALEWLSRQGHTDSVRSLLEAGAPVDARDLEGWTPLLWAAREGRTDVAAVLLAAGADPDASSPAARTPLVWAASRGDEALAQLLLDAGADVTQAFGATSPARWAELHGHDELASRLAPAEARS